MQLTDTQLRKFENDGYAIIPNLLDQARIDSVHKAMDRVYARIYNEDRRPRRIRNAVKQFGNEESVQWILNARVLDSEIWTLATDEEIGGVAAQLLGTDYVSIVEDQLLDKPAGGKPVNFHQDYGYWPFSQQSEMITGWIALIDMSGEIGPLQLVPGSHRWGTQSKPNELVEGSEGDLLCAVQQACPAGVRYELITAELSAGSGVFFHSKTFHGSRSNQSPLTRRAVSLHWAGAACRVKLAETQKMDFPYFFAGLRDDGPIVNKYMPVTYRKDCVRVE